MTWGKKSGKLELLSLADEILLRILSFLGGPDLLTFSTVCKHAKAFYESSSLLQYIAELDFTGCTDESLDERYKVIHTYHAKDSSAELYSRDGINGTKTLSISEKLSYLRKREYNWRTLDLAQNAKKVKLQRPIEIGAHDFVGTALGFFERGRVNMMEYIDMTEVSLKDGFWVDPSADCNAQSEDEFPEIPGNIKIPMSDVSLKQWTFDANVADLRLHLEDDLIAFVTYGKERDDDTNELWSSLP